jgi:hypothetical protein
MRILLAGADGTLRTAVTAELGQDAELITASSSGHRR